MKEDNEYDALKEIFSRKLENHQLPVDSSHWKAINDRLHGKSSLTKKAIVIWGSIAASIAIVLAITFLYYYEKSSQVPESHNFAENSYEHSKSPDDKPASVANSTDCKANTVMPKQPSKNMQAAASPIYQETPTGKSIDADIDIEQKSINETTAAKDAVATSGKQQWKTEIEKQPESSFTAKQTERQQPFSPERKKGKEWLLAASFHTNYTNSSLNNNAGVQPPSYEANLRSTNIYHSGDKVISPNKALIPDNTGGEYLPSLSFGLSLRKNINKRWGIETGLIYTYLSSDYRWNDSSPFDATQQLHYLGIPVNGVVYLWNNHSQWSVYFSAGAMLEKGLRMKTVRNQYLPDRVVTTTQESNIDGWQWSLNCSAGVSYRFADRMKLYIEPRLGYYFDNGQPVSIRTDMPVSIGFGAGLQYSF